MRTRLLGLAFGTFVIGTTEMLPSALITQIAKSLDTTAQNIGLSVTAYAMAVAVGGPVAAVLLRNRKAFPTLLASLAIFAAGHIVSALGNDLSLFVAGRIVTALGHGVFVAQALVIARADGNEEKIGTAISFVMGGFQVGLVAGVPLGFWLGGTLGWRVAFMLLIVVAGVAGALVVAAGSVSPKIPSDERVAPIREHFAELTRSSVACPLISLWCLIVGLWALATYVAVYLTRELQIDETWISGFFIVAGLAATLGVYLGGWIINQKKNSNTIVGLIGLLIAYVALWVLGSSVPTSSLGILTLLWLLTNGITIAFQEKAISAAQNAPVLVASLIAPIYNGGVGIGALAGGLLVGQGMLSCLPLVGALSAALAIWGVVSLNSQDVRHDRIC